MASVSILFIVAVGFSVLLLDTNVPSYEYSDELYYSEMGALRITNGTLSPASDYRVEEFAPGHFNVTFPSPTRGFEVELNESVVAVQLLGTAYWGLPSEMEDIVYLESASRLLAESTNGTFKDAEDRFLFMVSSGLSAARTIEHYIQLNESVIRSMIPTVLYLTFEIETQIQTDGYYVLNFAYAIDIILTYAQRIAITDISPVLTIVAGGVSSIVLLLFEIERKSKMPEVFAEPSDSVLDAQYESSE